MSSSGTVSLKDIWAMLDACAPGHKRKARKHNWLITYGALAYPSLPLGPHGKRTDPDIQLGHVRNMVRMLKIEDCAATKIEGLHKPKGGTEPPPAVQ